LGERRVIGFHPPPVGPGRRFLTRLYAARQLADDRATHEAKRCPLNDALKDSVARGEANVGKLPAKGKK
jgi:hypothetical protein